MIEYGEHPFLALLGNDQELFYKINQLFHHERYKELAVESYSGEEMFKLAGLSG